MPLIQNALSLSKFLRSSLKELMDGDIENASLNAQIRSIISKDYGNNFPDFSVVCDKLNMTPQTLRRRLKEEHTSYQEIKDNIRKDASVFYLSKPELTIDEIAMLMGFSEASSFHRAFKKWTGKTPSVFRQELLQQVVY
jgi:AraC-like DNA-binding protein